MQPDDRQEILAFQCGEDVKSLSRTPSELERLRRELEEAKEFRAILEGHLSAAIDDYNEARARAEAAEAKLAETRKAVFIEAAEIIRARMPLYSELQALNACRECISSIRAKAEEAGHE